MILNGNLRIATNHDGIFILLMIICGILLFTRWVFKKYYEDLFDFEKYGEKKDNFFLFNGLYILIFSTVIGAMSFPYFNKVSGVLQGYSQYSQLAIISALILFFIIVKLIVNSAIFVAIDKTDFIKPLLTSKSYYGVWTTLGILFFAFLLFFSHLNPYWLSLSVIVFMGLMLISSLYSFYKNIYKEYKFSIYYIILYLCALEIFPFMIVSKLILS